MMHMHGARAQELTSRSVGVALDRLVAVPVDVGKSSATATVVDFAGRRLAAPFEFALDRVGVERFAAGVRTALPVGTALVRSGWRRAGITTGRWSPHRCCWAMAAGRAQPGVGVRAAAGQRHAADQDRPDRLRQRRPAVAGRDHQVRRGVTHQVLHHTFGLRVRRLTPVRPEPVMGREAHIGSAHSWGERRWTSPREPDTGVMRPGLILAHVGGSAAHILLAGGSRRWSASGGDCSKRSNGRSPGGRRFWSCSAAGRPVLR